MIVEKILAVASTLQATGSTAASTGERIAAAFVLNRADFLPVGFDMVEAWDYLDDEWQQAVRNIKRNRLIRK